ncbi:hypothetical protein ACIBTV_26775 [Micromonospora sp. NPDC049366]|uniref:hypothetical protein n=1 Tax=Micromonospora sp. NPDC049366 TaxID=3364271 RepID=UPI003799E554
MCRYAFARYKTHFACLADRRTAKHPPGAAPRCPDCREPMVDLGRDFHAPRRADGRQWRKLALLVAAGRRAVDGRYRADGPLFDSCGCAGPGPRPTTLADAKTLLRRRRADRRAPAVKARTRIARRSR